MSALADGPFTLFGRRHTLVVGVDALRNKAIDSHGLGGQNPVVVEDIRNWDPYSYPEPAFTVSGASKPVDTRQQGMFATARFSVTDPLTLMVGGRLSWYEVNSSVNPANSYKPGRQFTPYAGVIYDLSEQLSAYASYTEIFAPQNSKGIDGGLLRPVTGKSYEAGIKGEFFGGRLNGSLGVFRVNNVGKAVEASVSPDGCADPTASCYVADGKTRSQGFEADLSGELLPGWQVMGGYTNTHTKYLRDSNASNVGQPLRTIDPRHTLRLFTSYRFGGALQGLTIGGGVNAYSDGYARSGAVTARQGGYAVYNAMLGYRVNDTWSLQLNINNLFDKVYFKKYAATGISNYYGDPRNVMLTMRMKF
jgi:outer membrane receptor for ferric coprogen and ferric-rhodotorulic acid